jgi:hypothetical protein
LPLYRNVRRWKDRRRELEHISFNDRLRVLQLPSVVSFVAFGNRPAVIASNEIGSLRKALADGLYVEPHPYLTIGIKVRIKQGPLAGSTGILVRKKDKLRVVLSLEIIMRSVAVEIESCDLEWIPGCASSPVLFWRGASSGLRGSRKLALPLEICNTQQCSLGKRYIQKSCGRRKSHPESNRRA